MLTVFPALLALTDRGRAWVSRGAADPRARLDAPALEWLARHRVPVLAVAAAFTAAALVAIPRVGFDYNLLNLQAKGTESVEWERRVLERAGRSGFTALATARDARRAPRQADRLRRAPVGLARGERAPAGTGAAGGQARHPAPDGPRGRRHPGGAPRAAESPAFAHRGGRASPAPRPGGVGSDAGTPPRRPWARCTRGSARSSGRLERAEAASLRLTLDPLSDALARDFAEKIADLPGAPRPARRHAREPARRAPPAARRPQRALPDPDPSRGEYLGARGRATASPPTCAAWIPTSPAPPSSPSKPSG